MAKTSSEEKTKETKKGFPILPAIGIGCLVILVLAGVGFAVVGKFFASQIGGKMVAEGIKQGIEKQTGMKVNEQNGVVSYKDTKTGSEVTIGGGTIPEDFPKDFPLYPGAKPTGSVAGNENGMNGKGYWLLLETPDAIATVGKYYGEQLKAKGWTVNDTMTFGDSTTYTVAKGTLEGTVIVAGNKNDSDPKTTILITLASKTGSSE